MSALQRVLEVVGNGIRFFVCVLAALAILWAMAYRLFFAFTPLWLDAVTYAGAGLAVLLVLALGKNETAMRENSPRTTTESK